MAGLLYATVGTDVAQLRRCLAELLPHTPFLGATSCGAVGSDQGGGACVTAMWFLGTGFSMGIAGTAKTTNPKVAAVRCLDEAARHAGIAVTDARFAVVHPTPGGEEAVVEGICEVLDPRATLIGGSAADNDLSGQWKVWTHEQEYDDGMVFAVCDWPGEIGISYQSGYMALPKRGTVTRALGRRLFEIDGRPAAEVYNEWMAGELSVALERGGTILKQTTLSPLGVARGEFGGITAYVLVHPERVIAKDHSLTTFAEVKEGEEVCLMRSNIVSLVRRGANVSNRALEQAALNPDEVVGGLMIYCAGLSLAISDRLGEMLDLTREQLPGIPFVMPFTFGEQGCVIPRHCDHGNLMVTAMLLSNRPRTW